MYVCRFRKVKRGMDDRTIKRLRTARTSIQDFIRNTISANTDEYRYSQIMNVSRQFLVKAISSFANHVLSSVSRITVGKVTTAFRDTYTAPTKASDPLQLRDVMFLQSLVKISA